MTQTQTNLPTLADLTQAPSGKTASKSTVPIPAGRSASATAAASKAASDTGPNATQRWSDADEASYRALQQRRKQAGHKGRGVNTAAQLLKPGSIKPNANTVAATIVSLIPAKGTITRGELLARMAATDFTSKSAKPGDRNWCQGYVAGVIRSGFVDVVSETSVNLSAAGNAA